ncbi:PREDICTED: uncharacterized protein LOC109470393 [Branchiostoma belcheri]|uniref:Uncharacterized protein LOC109470393 n=1 Tax=Branchiostoma belcheri TaxID=7741 RepID=A0A6P4YT23_BRABE|nr:PREDICTED: uncharacterized protein LOC109470393 [Branchiostoma belcheri]
MITCFMRNPPCALVTSVRHTHAEYREHVQLYTLHQQQRHAGGNIPPELVRRRGKMTAERKSFVIKVYDAEGFLYNLGITKKTEPVVVQRGDLVSKYIGQTTEMTRRKINQSKGGVMLVDEAYRLAQTDSSSRDVGRAALEEIMSVMEDGDPIMIFAGYPAEMASFLAVNPGMKSRIAYTFPFPDFSVEELANIMRKEVDNKGLR